MRGLFAGGTHCYEAQQIFLQTGIEVRSNTPMPWRMPTARLARLAPRPRACSLVFGAGLGAGEAAGEKPTSSFSPQ